MTEKPVVDIGEAFEQGTPIDEAMEEAYWLAVERHRHAGLPLVVWQDGRVVEIPPDELPERETIPNRPAPP